MIQVKTVKDAATRDCMWCFRPPNPIEFLAAFLLKNKNQFE